MKGSGEVGKPRRRRHSTRDALMSAGRRLLVTRPIDAVAIDEIVNAAGVAKGSFYNHFDGREALADSIRESIRQEIEAAVRKENVEVEDPARRVARALAVYVNYMILDPQRAVVLLRLMAGLASTRNPLNEGVLTDMGAGLLSGRFIVPSVDAGSLFVLGTAIIALMRAVEDPDRQAAAVMVQQLSSLLLRGLGISASESESISAAAVYQIMLSGDPIS